MADPVSMLANIAGLKLFVAKVTSESRIFFKSWKDASADAERLLMSLDIMHATLQDLEKMMTVASTPTSATSLLEEKKFRAVIDEIHNTFKELENIMMLRTQQGRE